MREREISQPHTHVRNLFMKCVRVTFYVTKYFGRNKFAIIAAGAAAAAFSVIFNNVKSILRRFCDSKDGCPYLFFRNGR